MFSLIMIHRMNGNIVACWLKLPNILTLLSCYILISRLHVECTFLSSTMPITDYIRKKYVLGCPPCGPTLMFLYRKICLRFLHDCNQWRKLFGHTQLLCTLTCRWSPASLWWYISVRKLPGHGNKMRGHVTIYQEYLEVAYLSSNLLQLSLYLAGWLVIIFMRTGRLITMVIFGLLSWVFSSIFTATLITSNRSLFVHIYSQN
jgi:hypothetical protein